MNSILLIRTRVSYDRLPQCCNLSLHAVPLFLLDTGICTFLCYSIWSTNFRPLIKSTSSLCVLCGSVLTFVPVYSPLQVFQFSSCILKCFPLFSHIFSLTHNNVVIFYFEGFQDFHITCTFIGGTIPQVMVYLCQFVCSSMDNLASTGIRIESFLSICKFFTMSVVKIMCV